MTSTAHTLALAVMTVTLTGCAWWGGGEEGLDRSDAATARAEASEAATAPADPAERRRHDTCGASRLDDLVGSPLTPQVRQLIVARSSAEQYRVLAPDMMATMDHQPQRLNIHVDDSDRVRAFDCG